MNIGRATEYADVLLSHNAQLEEGETVFIVVEEGYRIYAEILRDLALKRGTKVIIESESIENKVNMILRNDQKEMEERSRTLVDAVNRADICILVKATDNLEQLKDIDREKVKNYRDIVSMPYGNLIMGLGTDTPAKRYVVSLWPSHGFSKVAKMTFKETEELIYSAGILDWNTVRKDLIHSKSVFDNAGEVRIIVQGLTDIRFSLEGRGGNVSCGGRNMPDGELFYGPVEDSMNGYITFPYENRRLGTCFPYMRINFRNGEIYDFHLEQNKELFREHIEFYEIVGAGEFGRGGNPNILMPTNILEIDEKIDGTLHFALGYSHKRALNDGGGLMFGKDHWDLICDLRSMMGSVGGTIFVDGKTIYQNNQWIKQAI